MTTPSSLQKLLQQATTADWISFFQSLLDAKDLSPDEALALAGLIHARLRNPVSHKGSNYAQYARIMAALNHYLPDTFQHVSTNWQLNHHLESK